MELKRFRGVHLIGTVNVSDRIGSIGFEEACVAAADVLAGEWRVVGGGYFMTDNPPDFGEAGQLLNVGNGVCGGRYADLCVHCDVHGQAVVRRDDDREGRCFSVVHLVRCG